MSATLNVNELLANKNLFKDEVNVINIRTKTYPVNVYYNKNSPDDLFEDINKKVSKIHQYLPKGGILIFLPGKQDILKTVEILNNTLKQVSSKAYLSPQSNSNDPKQDHLEQEEAVDEDFDLKKEEYNDTLDEKKEFKELSEIVDKNRKTFRVLPLYSKMENEQQDMIFDQSESCRLIVVATNVAETSLTIPGLKYLIDSGLEKVKVLDKQSQSVKYNVQYISQASALQRQGRVGRTGIGHCYRLYTPGLFDKMKAFRAPEITQVSLNHLILQLTKIGIPDITRFPFITRPSKEQLRSSLIHLLEIKSLTMISPSQSQKPKFILTSLGEVLSHIPLEPLHAKIILEARKASCLLKGIILIAVLVFEEIFDIDKFKNNLEEWKLKILQKSTGLRSLLIEKFKDFINPVSDLLTRVNMIYYLLSNIITDYASFKKEEISEKSLFYLVDHISQYLLWQDSFINKQINSFVTTYSMNKKLVIEMIKFCLQIIKLMISIEDTNDKKISLIQELQSYTKTSKKEQKILSELLIKNMNHKILLKKEMIIGEKKVYKIYDEDQNEVKIINSCLISRNTSFYIYSMKLQVNNGFIVSGLTKINDVSLLLKHSPQYTQIQIDQKSFCNLSKSESLLKINSIFGKARWTANGLIVSLTDIKSILTKNSTRISQMNSLKKFSKQMEGILIKEIENDFSSTNEFDCDKELENAQKVLSAVSCKMILNGSYYPKVKVLENKLLFDVSKLSMDQMFSSKSILPLLLYVKKHRLFSQKLLESQHGIENEQFKGLILDLVQPKWQSKCKSMYHKIFQN